MAVALGAPAGGAWAQGDVQEEVTVAVLRDAAPFSYQAPDGTWKGLVVEMWDLVARQLHLDSRFTGMNRSELIDAVSTGQARFGIGALSITAERLQRVDFSAPVYVTGVAILVPYVPRSAWGVVCDALLSATFMRIVGGLLALLAVVGTIFWIIERRYNPDFSGTPAQAWGSGVWLSIVTMSTVGYGDKAPRTLGGRVVAALWMFVSIMLISIFTGTIATLLTVERIGARVRGFEDLGHARVACVGASAARPVARGSTSDRRILPRPESGTAGVGRWPGRRARARSCSPCHGAQGTSGPSGPNAAGHGASRVLCIRHAARRATAPVHQLGDCAHSRQRSVEPIAV